MALIRVNDKDENLLGALSFDREAKYDEYGKIIGMTIKGILAIHDYEDEIKIIESERYRLDDVEVYKESFGSNEYMILYSFTAGKLTIKPDNVDDNIKWLIEEDTIAEETKAREWYHAYLRKDAYKEVEKLANRYKVEEGDKDES